MPNLIARSLAVLKRSFWSEATTWQPTWGYQRTAAGVAVTPHTALGLTAAYAAINVLSTDTASPPIGVFRRRSDGGRDEARDHPLHEVLNVSPDGERTAMRFRQALMGHVLGWGNGCAEIETDNGGRVIGLHLLEAGTKAYRALDNSTTSDGSLLGTGTLYYLTPKGVKIPAWKTLHIAGLSGDGINGYSPITLAREAISLGLAAERFGGSWYGNGTRTGGWIKLAKALKSDEAKKNLRESIERVHQGVDSAHKIGILEEGMEFTPTTINPEEGQFLATRQFQVIEIARMFRLPPHKIGDYSQSHLANVEEANLDYLVTVLLGWCEQIEQAMNFRLFSANERKQGFFVEHNMMAFLRGNMAARADFYTKLRDLGVLTPNQIARFENLNPIGPEGDIRLVPLNMTSLANAGKPTPTDPAKGQRDLLIDFAGRNGHADTLDQ